jgi:fructosamine-3-kinase
MTDTNLENILEALAAITPRSREELLKNIPLILAGCLTEVRDRHNTKSAIFIFNTPGGKYFLKGEYGTDNATTKEVHWYNSVHSSLLAPPAISSLVKGDYAYLLLPYIEDAKTLDELVESNSISKEKLLKYITSALSMDRHLLAASKPKTVSHNEVNNFYLKKYQRRAKESQRFTYLSTLLETPTHRINDQTFHSPSYYLTKIAENSKLHTYLTPNIVSMIHGDLHCGNILIKKNSIYCVDPNGLFHLPIEYDYGKILHSIHGGYHQIMRGQYGLKVIDNGFHFEMEIPDAYNFVHKKIKAQLTEQEYLRGLYAEALHFATLLPHHATERTETTALFLRCIQLFEEMFYYMGIK